MNGSESVNSLCAKVHCLVDKSIGCSHLRQNNQSHFQIGEKRFREICIALLVRLGRQVMLEGSDHEHGIAVGFRDWCVFHVQVRVNADSVELRLNSLRPSLSCRRR